MNGKWSVTHPWSQASFFNKIPNPFVRRKGS